MNDSATRLNITSVRFNVVQLQTSVLPTWTGLTPLTWVYKMGFTETQDTKRWL